MSYNPARSSMHFRQPPGNGIGIGNAAGNSPNFPPSQQQQQPPPQNPALLARINEKREELQNLLELKDLSSDLAKKMEQLEEKINTLADGTHAVAMVLSNWENVIRAIALASSKISDVAGTSSTIRNFESDPFTDDHVKDDGVPIKEENLPMPVPLVRIPTQQYL